MDGVISGDDELAIMLVAMMMVRCRVFIHYAFLCVSRHLLHPLCCTRRVCHGGTQICSRCEKEEVHCSRTDGRGRFIDRTVRRHRPRDTVQRVDAEAIAGAGAAPERPPG